MRYILLIPDGAADKPVAELGGKTPLAALNPPGMAALAGGMAGQARTVPMGVAPGSDTAILTIFGNDVKSGYKGRAALEAAGAGIGLQEGEAALRVNLCSISSDKRMASHNGFGIEGDDALALADALARDETFSGLARRAGFTIHPSPTFRQIGVLANAGSEPFDLAEPHMILGRSIEEHLPRGGRADELTALIRASYLALSAHPLNISRGGRAANCVWPWAAGRAMALPDFADKYGRSGPVISAVPLVKGIARLSGLPAPDVPGATGDIDTNYEGKLDALLDGFKAGADFGCVHVEAPDECAHARDAQAKTEAIRRFDSRIIMPLLERMPRIDPDFRVLMLSDHLTLLSSGAHDGAPVPFALYDSRNPGKPRPFSEDSTRYGRYIADGSVLMDLLFERE